MQEKRYYEQCPSKLTGVVNVGKRRGLDDNKSWASGAFGSIEQGKRELCADMLPVLEDPGLERH